MNKASHFAACCVLTLQAWGAPVAKPKPNVILITIDTVRADHLGCYGYKDIKTPTIDSLARDGVVFEHAVSQVPLTWPSHAAILTGTYPFQNGVQDFTGQPLAPQFRSIAQAFKQQGYATGAVVSAFVLDRSWGLARGFDFYDDAFSAETFARKDIGLVDRRAAESVTRALHWLQKTQKRPFFLWLHLYDPHSPYDPPEPFGSQYRAHPYDGEIAYADRELGRLISWLKSTHLYDQSLIALLSDHGESLGDHGEHEHGFFIYNSTVHIPLIVKVPAGRRTKSKIIKRVVETTSVAPTLLDVASINDQMSKQFHSPSLFDDIAGSKDLAYSETFYTFSSFGWSPLHGLETERYHYIDAPLPELYDLVADPEEKNNLAFRSAAPVAVFKDKLQSLLRISPFKPSAQSSAGLSPDALAKLSSLGYVAYRSPVSQQALAAGLPDPKSKMLEFNAILDAETAFHQDNFSRGEDLLIGVGNKDPGMYIVPFLLGEAALRQQKWEPAASYLTRTLDLNPNFDQAMTGLARALIYLGRGEEAKEWSQKALKFNPQNYRAWYQLGFIESKTDQRAAIADYEKAVSIQGNFAPLRRDLGMAYFQQQNYSEAAKNLLRACELGVREASVYNFLGISYSRINQITKAVEAYHEALKQDANLPDAHLNLAYAYQRANQNQAASREYEAACKMEQKYCRFIPTKP